MNIYIGNLAWETRDEDLQKAFAAYGEVTSAKVITDSFTGKSRGFGFVEMADRTQAETAINALNNQPLNGRPIKVNEARPKTEGGGKKNGGFRDRERRW